ncbi:MAG: hypothetical protein ACIALR_12270 [Blastopirellula sp. JB062]
MTEPTTTPENEPVAPTPRGRSWFGIVCKVSLYSICMLCAGTLFAAQYVPEVANALSFFLPAEEASACSLSRQPCCSSQPSAAFAVSTVPSCCSDQPASDDAACCPSEMLTAEVDSKDQLAQSDAPPIVD